MASKRADSRLRKDTILGIVVEQYVRTITPVSSQFIVSEYPLDLSSATIRHVLAELEEEGFLTHPHTSAGRLPTEQGYRYYVDNLMDEIKLLEEEKNRIRKEYLKEKGELETLLDQASKFLCDTTHYTSLVSVDGWGSKLFLKGTSFVVNYPDFQDLNKIKNILITLEEKERILDIINQHLEKKIKIFIGHELPLSEIDSCSLVISRYQLRKGPSGRIAVLGPTRMDYERVISAIEYLSNVINDI